MAMDKAHHKAKMIGLSRSECPGSWIGDGMCDGGCNDEENSWDGGDCCGDMVNNMFCFSNCECLDPNPQGTGKVDPCPPGWSGDGICDDFCNNEANGFDGGDCCGDGPWYAFWFCTVCECLE